MIIDERRALRASATASAASINILSRGCEAGLNPLTLEALPNVELGWDEISESASVLE